jgi:predicted nucleic acid-binding Zn ribbon protein
MDQICGHCKTPKDVSEFSPSYRGKPGTWCRACFSAYKRGERGTTAQHQPLTCDHCGKKYVPTHLKGYARYCSRSCKEEVRRAALAAEREASKPERECLHCGSSLPQSMRADAVFCSEKCNYAAHALQRKLRARTGDENKPGYLRAAICKRDKWRCGICGQRVNPTLEHPHPRAASLDHIVPVSEGGGNEPANLRLVHLVCNLRRRNLGGGEQLALV